MSNKVMPRSRRPSPASKKAPSAAEDKARFVDPLGNWFARKWLMFESTFALSMLEPWEKVLVLSLCFFLFSLLTIGIYRYLPFHLQFVSRRTRFYLLGDENAPLTDTASVLGSKLS